MEWKKTLAGVGEQLAKLSGDEVPRIGSRLVIDGHPVAFREGDSVLMASLRHGIHPTGSGCLCNEGDCANCLVSIAGVAYVRSCQVKATAGLKVELYHQQGQHPPLDFKQPAKADISLKHLHCDVVVIGRGDAGQEAAHKAIAEGKEVVSVDAKAGQEVIGIYSGPLVVVCSDEGMLNIHPKDIIIATGAAEIMPVVEGNHLKGIFTPRAALAMQQAGVDLGKLIAVGDVSHVLGLEAVGIGGGLERLEGNTHLEAVVIRTEAGEERHPCDSVCISLGFHPRDALVRMAQGLSDENHHIHAVGDCAKASDIPPCPRSGLVCACSGVTAADLEFILEQGFREMELVKRATLAGTGTCQGSACLPHLRSFLHERGGKLQAAFTARPLTKQVTMAEIAAGAHTHATPRTALDAEHRRLGAQMERIGGWWRPWHYGDVWAEYWAVREAVSIGDVSTLGKMLVSGPDALEFLERVYPTQISSLKTGRSRYVLLLNERGYVMDDGLVVKEGEGRYGVTFTSGGSSHAEAWLRDWASTFKLNIRIMNQTMSLGAINITGPLSKALLERAGLTNPPAFMHYKSATVAGVPCKIYRLSFTGEISYELHHPAEHSVSLWRSLMALGKDLGIKPHGLEALVKLRLEKGHILVGQDSDFDSTPRRIQHEWMVKLDKPDFIGRTALLRTGEIPLDKQLVGFEMMDSQAPKEGAVVWVEGNYAGYITSSTYSPMLAKSVMLGWLRLQNGHLPEEVTIEGRRARRVSPPFYDVEGQRARG